MWALSTGALVLVAGDLTELQPMKQLTATIGQDGSQPLPLASGEISSPTTSPTTLPRSLEPFF